MLKIAIGTLNPAKVLAVKNVFQFKENEILPTKVPSGVSDQPFSDEETMEGAVNRAIAARKKENADIGIGLEGGVVETPKGLFLVNWGALCTRDDEVFVAGGARIPLPKEVADGVRAGKELGVVMNEYTNKLDVGKNEGAIGVFTSKEVSRADMFTHILKLVIGQYKFAKNQKRQSLPNKTMN